MNILKILLLSFFLFSSFAPNDRVESNGSKFDCSLENNIFDHGETITYEIYYNLNFVWISAGEVTFQVRELDNAYQLKAVGKTYPSYEWFFKVRDTVESIVSKDDLLPLQTTRVVNEGKYRRFDLAQYNREQFKVSSKMGKSRSSADDESIDISACTHDILSLIYSLRNMEFDEKKRGYSINTEIYLDRKTYPIGITYKGVNSRKKIRGLGRCNTLRFSPDLIVGEVFSKDNGMEVWVSNDKNKIPLLIESPVSVGSIKAVLKDFRGLRYPPDFKS